MKNVIQNNSVIHFKKSILKIYSSVIPIILRVNEFDQYYQNLPHSYLMGRIIKKSTI